MRVLLAGLLLIAGSCFGQSFGATEQNLLGQSTVSEFLPVDEAYQVQVELLGDQRIGLFWQIAPTYYLYQHQFSFTLEDQQGDIGLDTTMPKALTRTDEYFGEVQVYYDNADITLNAQRASGQALLTVASQGCADAGLCYPPHKLYFTVDFDAGTAHATTFAAAPVAADKAPRDQTALTAEGNSEPALLYMLALAFLGGAILNLMPCVFPILSLKVLSFARSTDHDRHLQSWIYTAGVIISFVTIAAVLLGLQQAGSAIGWGFQLQSTGFVIALAYLFIAMGLSLSGLVEFGGTLMNTGSGLANRQGLSGSFFTGILAVVVASPCTAPFMGTALGFAVSQPPQIGLLVFTALGAGMAAPLLLFSYSGAARALMPKPGPWMETLKQFLAFPLYGTAIWLLWVAGRQAGVNTMATALCGTLMLALGLWLWHHSLWRRALAVLCVISAIGLGSVRGLDTSSGHATRAADKAFWSDQEVATARAAGQPVFVDVTADWCITCIANETAVLFTKDMTQAFADHDVVYMVADWTNHNAEIAALLQRHGRNGIPLYLIYPANPDEQPMILPQVLTKKLVLDALATVAPIKSDFNDIF